MDQRPGAGDLRPGGQAVQRNSSLLCHALCPGRSIRQPHPIRGHANRVRLGRGWVQNRRLCASQSRGSAIQPRTQSRHRSGARTRREPVTFGHRQQVAAPVAGGCRAGHALAAAAMASRGPGGQARSRALDAVRSSPAGWGRAGPRDPRRSPAWPVPTRLIRRSITLSASRWAISRRPAKRAGLSPVPGASFPGMPGGEHGIDERVPRRAQVQAHTGHRK